MSASRNTVIRYPASSREKIPDEVFLPLRLQNGVYHQRHSHMLRVAIPYGVLSSKQMRALAGVADRWDQGWGHFTTRQNIQFNWVRLEDTPDILAYLAEHDMHAIQTSGNCIRNIVIDVFAGAAADEIVDPRPLAEIIRQWATLNPEFAYLPRKFKIAISGATTDRALLQANDVGLQLYRNAAGKLVMHVYVGGGLGRTPIIGTRLTDALPWQDTLSYLEAIVRVFNRHGRRDNKYKARIKILVQSLGIERFAEEVAEEWTHLRGGPATIPPQEYQRVAQHFRQDLPACDGEPVEPCAATNPDFARWQRRNVIPHATAGYANVVLSTKPGAPDTPGDISSEQMRAIAEWAERFGTGEIRIAYDQNVVLTHIRRSDLYALWQAATAQHLATANIGLLTDIIACPRHRVLCAGQRALRPHRASHPDTLCRSRPPA